MEFSQMGVKCQLLEMTGFVEASLSCICKARREENSVSRGLAGVLPAGHRTAAAAAVHGGRKIVPLLDLSSAYTPKPKNSQGIRIHASFVPLVSRSVRTKLDSRSITAFNGTSAIRAPSSKLIDGKHFGGGWKLSQRYKVSRLPPSARRAVVGIAVPTKKRGLSHA
ncbi:hypothetical protein JCGZ_11181 [Jatropha curcas]|uniref:Uncharacterized protein n=1 Tax=Jatropha curcas TaxID=180498 RepID=A0A067KSL5_JATCU|nr:hypothetical protein JCGZ_11181 [Jatropha curcas]